MQSHEFLKQNSEYPLPHPAASLVYCGNKIYVAFKRKYIAFLPLNQECNKEIRKRSFGTRVEIPGHVTALANSNDTLYVGEKEGTLLGINRKHNIVLNSSADTTPITYCLFDSHRQEVIVSSYSKKITVYSKEGILKSSHYLYTTPVIHFDFTKDGKVAAVSQNNQTVRIIDRNTSEFKEFVLKESFPEVVAFLSANLMVVGTDSGKLLLVNTKNLKVLSEILIDSAIHLLHNLGDGLLLAGTLSPPSLVLLRSVNKTIGVLERRAVDGIPVAAAKLESGIAVALSREPRIGRWGKMKTGKNKLVVFDIQPEV